MKGCDQLKECDCKCKIANVISWLSMLIAVLALLAVFHYCYPDLEHDVRQIIGGLDISPVRQAFYTMSDQLEQGSTIKETVAETVKVLFE